MEQVKQRFCEEGMESFVAAEEKRHADAIEQIAKRIQEEAEEARVILIGGPSSAGKTTFSKRLTFHLNRKGVSTLILSTDDYFVGDAKNPRDEDGNLDYEHILAIDLELLNQDLLDLMAGRVVMMPKFDFTSHERSQERMRGQLAKGGVIIIEGLHSLNPELTPQIPMNEKLLILADTISSPFDRMLEAENGDGRLIRRMIRDSKYRGRTPEKTIELWPSICTGERRWIRPYVENAEVIFDTTLAYEPMVLKGYAQPLLNAIDSTSPIYPIAKRLQALLEKVPFCEEGAIPGYSILREYIGGSILHY